MAETALPQPKSIVPTLTFPFLSAPEGPGEVGRLAGYRVLGKLGEGSQGVVFLAQDLALLRLVALKVIKPEFAASSKARERFLREARIVAALRSDHVVNVYHLGEANRLPFQAMEYLKGSTLRNWLAANNGQPQLPTVVQVARDLFRGLAAVHEKGLVHRDIKPSNLWLESRGGRVKLFDFGLTRQVNGRRPRRRSIIGTPGYMSPEQARGEPVDPRADLFSAGVVLYRMLAGHSPFQRDTNAATFRAVISEEPRPLAEVVPGLPVRLTALVGRLLDKDPARRPGSAWLVLAGLAQVLGDLHALAPKLLRAAGGLPGGEPIR
ncbi:MAG: serine/threonine-protein kinase [Gemmataceae bacterium]